MTGRRFLPLDLPERFVVEVPDGEGGWTDYGLYDAAKFERLENGALVCTGWGPTPFYLRCIRQEGNVIDVLDGVGEQYTYRIVPFPGGGYSEST